MKRNIFLFLILVLFFTIACEDSVNSNDNTEDLPEQIYNKFVMLRFVEDGAYPSQNDLYFFNSENGVSVGLVGTYFTTNNSGDSWTLSSAPDEVDLWKVSGIDENYWFASTKNLDINYIYKVENGNWIKLDLPPMYEKDYVSSIYFIDKSIGYVSTSRDWSSYYYNLIFKTNDAGESWDTVATFSSPIHNINMFDENNGFCTTTSVGILKTDDGWKSWSPVTPDGLVTVYNYPHISHIEKIDAQHLIAVGGAGFGADKGFVCTSSDGGLNWEYSLIEHNLNDVAVTSDKIFVCGDESYVAQYDINLSSFSSQEIINNLNVYSCKYEEGSDFVTQANAPWGVHTDFTKIQFTDDTHGFVSSNVYQFRIVLQ